MEYSYITRFQGMKRLYNQLFEPLLAQYALNQSEMDILLFLANNPPWDTARDIVELRHLAKSHVSVGVEKLVQQGLLERFFLNGNRKTIHLRLLPAAREPVRQGRELQRQFSELLVADFSPEERGQLDALLDRIARNVHQSLAK